MRRVLVLLVSLVWLAGCPDSGKQQRAPRNTQRENPPAKSEPQRSRHGSHEHGHGAHPHARDAHHHHPHPHPHLDGVKGHHHPY